MPNMLLPPLHAVPCPLLLTPATRPVPPSCSLAVAAGDTPADAYPFVALIADKEAPLCAGALVAPRVVLTSASCVTASDADPSIVYVGMLNFFLDEFRWVTPGCRDW